MAHGELGDPAMIERDQDRRRRRVERHRLSARRGERTRVEQVAFHEQRDVLERDARERRRLDQRLLLALFLRRVLVGELLRATLAELLIGEHAGGNLTAGDVDHRCGLAVREPDRVEDEHVALELPVGDSALGHRRDQILIRDALEEGQTTEQRVGLL